MNFWHMQLHPNQLNWGKERELLEKTELIGMGEWEELIDQQDKFENVMQIGDIVAIKRGGTYLALVKVIGDYEYNSEKGDLDWFERRRQVKVLDWYNPKYGFYVSPRGTLTRCDMDSDAATNFAISTWYEKIMNDNKMNTIINVLKYKKQIILQGPPGTGKTMLAKEIANELTKPKSIGSPTNTIDHFLKNFPSNNAEIKAKREQLNALLEEFNEKFPRKDLKNLTLEEYAFGKGDNDTFCYWLEYVLWEHGLYSGFAKKFLIFWKKETEDYSKTGFLKDLSNEEAIKKLSELLYNLANNIDSKEALKYLGNGLILKVLYTYNPDIYFPINNEKCINNGLKLLGLENSKLNIVEKSKKLQELFIERKNKLDTDITNLEFMRFLFDNFDMKGEISVQSDEVITNGESELIQFHPSYSYEDFVRGIVAETNSESQVEYKVVNKILAKFAEKALDNPSANYVLIIDEINRANLPAVLGELIYALEYRFDKENPNDTTVKSMYALKINKDDEEGTNELKLPKNLYIVGTMNTADRSVGHIDYAIRRRFAFVEVLPTNAPIGEVGKELFKKVSSLFIKNFDTLNWNDLKLERSDYLASDFIPEDVWLGHSYFMTREKDQNGTILDENAQMEIKLKFEIRPILKEYLKDGILNESAREFIANL